MTDLYVVIRTALAEHHMLYTVDANDTDSNLLLAEMLAPPGADNSVAQEELDHLADEIAGAVEDALAEREEATADA